MGSKQSKSAPVNLEQARKNINKRVKKFCKRCYPKYESSAFAQKAEEAAPEQADQRDLFLHSVYVILVSTYDHTRDPEDLNKAIAVLRKLNRRNPMNAWPLQRTVTFASLLWKRYTLHNDPSDLEEGIELLQEVVHFPELIEFPAEAIRLLWYMLGSRSERTGCLIHLNDHIDSLRDPRNELPTGDPEIRFFKAALAHSLGQRYDLTRNGDDLDAAFDIVHEQSLRHLPEGYPDRYICYDIVGILLRHRGERRKCEQDLTDAIGFGETVLNGPTLSETQRAVYQSHLSCRLHSRYKLTHVQADLNRAITLGEIALSRARSLSFKQNEMASMFQIQRDAYWDRFTLVRNSKDLDSAIEYAREALDAVSSQHPNYWGSIIDLGTLLALKYQETKKDGNGLLEESIRVLRNDPHEISNSDLNLHNYKSSLSNRLWRRYLDLGQQKDLLDSVSLREDAGKALKPTVHDQGIHFNNFSNLMGLKYELYGNPNDLQASVSLGQKAVDFTSGSHVVRGEFLNTLSRWVHAMYTDSRATEYLERAIDLSEKAVHAIGDSSPEKWLIMNTLSALHRDKYNRTGDGQALTKSIDVARKITATMPEDNPNRPMFQIGLAFALRSRDSPHQAADSKHKNDLEEAISLSRQAYKDVPRGDHQRHMYLNGFGKLLVTKYDREKSQRDLDLAIRLGREALSICPEHRPERAMLNLDLGDWLELHPSPQTATAMQLYKEAFSSTSGPPLMRTLAAWLAGRNLCLSSNWVEANKMLDQAITDFLPQISPRWLPRDDQQYSLKELSGLSALAAAAALNAHRGFDHALVISEAGHGIMAGIIIDLRNDLARLAEINAKIASEYGRLQDRVAQSTLRPHERFTAGLSRPGPREPSTRGDISQLPSLMQIEDIRADVKRLDELEEEIRGMKDFEHFRKALSKSEILQLAKTGAIVSFNVTEFRCDAFVITDHIDLVELPRLHQKELEQQVQQLVGPSKLARRSRDSRIQRNDEMRKILAWLWDVAVVDVLKRLKLITTDAKKRPQDMPRIWWLASGLMGLTPLHAAGKYEADGSSKECTSMYAISSYIPTLKALKFAQGRKLRRLRERTEKILIISMPKTAGESPLGADIESREILESISLSRAKSLPSPLKRTVLKELPTSTVVHFACHGTADARDPSSGALLLRHKKSDKNDPLTVRELAAVRHDKAQIAYLSACSTAENPVENLRDEVIHLASTFQLIGFPHVIGTLWEAADDTAREVARLFYVLLMDKMRKKSFDGNPKAVAEALHEAVERRRYREGANFLGWVPFIHLGA